LECVGVCERRLFLQINSRGILINQKDDFDEITTSRKINSIQEDLGHLEKI
jgi:hypothetical protein